MSSRFELSDEPVFSNSYNWRTSTKLKFDEPEEANAAKRSASTREVYDTSDAKSPVAFRNSYPLTRSVDLFSSSIGYDIDPNGIERKNGRPKSPDFTSTGSDANVPGQSLSRAETPSSSRRSNNDLTRSVDLGNYGSLPSSSYDHQNNRSKTAVTRQGETHRVMSRPPIAPGRPRPQPSDTLPRSGTPSAQNTQHGRTADTERYRSLSDNKRALHSSINSLDYLRYADAQQLYDKHSTGLTSSTNVPLDRPGSRSSTVGSLSRVQSGLSLGTPGERKSSSTAHKSVLSESRSKSALGGSLDFLERTGTPVKMRSLAGTPDFATRDKSSSLRHSTDMDLGASYDEIIKRLRKMETQNNFRNLGMKLDTSTDHRALESQSPTRRPSAHVGNNVLKKKSTGDYLTERPSQEFSDPDDFKDSSLYDRKLTGNKVTFQYKDGRKPALIVKAAEVSDKSYLDLSNRTGERMSAYSKNGAIESWLRSVTNESSDSVPGQLNGDKSALRDSSFSIGDHQEYKESTKQSRPIKKYDTFNGYDKKARDETSRKLANDSHQRATSPTRQSVAKKDSMVVTHSKYDVKKPTHSTSRGFEADLPLAKQERGRADLSANDPKTRPYSRLSLLRKYLDQADCIGTQSVDNGYLKLPDELGMDDLRRSSSALDHRSSTRNSSHLNSSTGRKMSSDMSYLGNSSNPVYTTTTLTRTPSTEAFIDKGLYVDISSSRERLDRYKTSSNGQREEDPTLRGENNFQKPSGYSFNALTSSLERPRSPTRSFADTAMHNSEHTRLETDNQYKDNSYSPTSMYYNKTPSYSSTGQDWMSRSYEKSALGDVGNVEEKKKHDVSGFQPTGGYADSRTLLSILENNRKYKASSSVDLNGNPEAKHSSRETAELGKLVENVDSVVGTPRDLFSKSSKEGSRIENEPGNFQSGSDFTSRVPPKRVWYSEERLSSSTNDPDNDIAVRFDYKPDTYRYVLRKDAVVSNGEHDRSTAATGVRKWRSDLALSGDIPESKDPLAVDSRNIGLGFLRNSSFLGTKEVRSPERRQVTWQDEVLLDKESESSSIARNGIATAKSNMFDRKDRLVSPSAKLFTSSFERSDPTERTRSINDSPGLVESRSLHSLHQSLRSESPYSKSFRESTLPVSSRPRDDDQTTKLKQTVSGDSNRTLLHEFPSDYRPSSSLYDASPRSQSPYSKSFITSTWDATGRDEVGETRLKQIVSGDSNPTSLQESPSNYRPLGSLYENLRSHSPSSKRFLSSTWSSSEDRETKQKQTVSGGDSNPTPFHESPSDYRPSYRPSSRLSSTSYTYSDHEPLSTKESNIALNGDYSGISTANQSKPAPNDHSSYKRHTPTNDSCSTKTAAYLSTNSIYKSSYSPTGYTSSAPPGPHDTPSDNLTGNYATPNPALNTGKEPASRPYSSLGITEFLASRSASKLSSDSYQADGVQLGKWRSLTSNGGSTSGVSDSHRNLLSSSINVASSHKDSSHLMPASSLDFSAKEMSSTRGYVSSSKPHLSDDASAPINLATTDFPHDIGRQASSILSSTDASAKDYSTTGLPNKYLSYSNYDDPSPYCSTANTFGQSSTPFSDLYSGIGHHVGLTSSRGSSPDDLHHLRSDSLPNGTSTRVDFLSGVADKHDDGLSLASESEFVVMRSGDIVKRPFKKSDKSDSHIPSRYSKTQVSARYHLGLR